jgi:DNA replication licensing factor MCM6
MIDPLDFADVHGLGGTANGGPRTEAQTGESLVARPPRRKGKVDPSTIPRVKDTTGESVMRSFEGFLEK